MESRAVVLFTLAILTCLLRKVDSSPTRSSCETQSSVSIEAATDHSIPRRCRKGKMTWHYPMGSLILHFKPRIPKNRNVWVCVSAETSAIGMGLSNVIGKNERHLPNFGSNDYSMCVPTVDGRVNLKWEAKKTVDYMAVITYTIVMVPR